MNHETSEKIEKYAAVVLDWLDIDAKEDNVPRSALVELFIDTLQALEQNKEQED